MGRKKIIYNYLMNVRGAFAERHFMKCDLQDLIRIIPAKGSRNRKIFPGNEEIFLYFAENHKFLS